MTTAPTSPEPAAEAGRGGRARHRGIGAKLLIAFGLIAALTVGATLVSLIRFNEVERVLSELIDGSMPTLKLAMDVQLRAADVIETAGEVGEAQDETERFNRMSQATDRIGALWQAVEKLRSVVSTATMEPIQALIAQIDSQVGELSRTVGEGLASSQAPARLFQQIGETTAAANRTITAVIDRLNRAVASADDTARNSSRVADAHDLRSDINDAARILNSTRQANSNEALASLRAEFDAATARVQSGIAKLGQLPGFAAETEALTGAAQRLAALSTGADGLFALRNRFLGVRASFATTTGKLKQDSAQLRERVAAVVADAERQASESQHRSNRALATSRIWLMLIALSTIVIAGLIVWLFVHRYVVSRLEALSGSMLGIARGNLAAPIPPAGSDELGDMSRALVVFRDNAREIEIARDEAVKARGEAEAASRAKSTFLANMSHELRTPLNAIIGYSEMLSEDATDRGDTTAVQDLNKIQSAGKHLLGLINSILDLSKIEAGRMDVYLEQVDIAGLIGEVRALVQPLVEKNGNNLVIEQPADLGSMRTDMTKVKQSLINLLSNAAKFTEKGTISLNVSRRAGPAGSSHVVFAVKDSGIGMTDEQMARLFTAFSQADSSTTRNFGGTGLGLAITRRFATLLGGTIEVSSEPGRGSTFTLELPDQAAGVSASSEIMLPAGAADGLTVLVVDDDPAVHDVVTPTLTRKGYRVLHARDGAEALDMLRKNPPDVVTLDVMMPNVDGWTVLGRMKSDPALAHIPVIMLTIVDDRNLGYSLGASEYMTKPVDRERLLALVRRFTGRTADAMVLIVDDDPQVRNVIGTTLRKTDLRTAEAANGREALGWLAANPPPDLVLLDLMMPEMDGFEFLERLNERPEPLHVPIVVLTAKELTTEERALLAERTVLVLAKSAQPINTLGAALAAIATARHTASPDTGARKSA